MSNFPAGFEGISFVGANNAREYYFLNVLKILLPGQPDLKILLAGQPDDMRLNTRAAMEETDDGGAGIVEPERTSTRKRVERGARKGRLIAMFPVSHPGGGESKDLSDLRLPAIKREGLRATDAIC